MDSGLRWLTASLRTMDSGLRLLTASLRTMDSGLRWLTASLRTMDSGLRWLTTSLRTMDSGLRWLTASLRTMDSGLRWLTASPRSKRRREVTYLYKHTTQNCTYVIRKRNLTTSLLFQNLTTCFGPYGPSSGDTFEDFLLYCNTSIIFTSVRLSIAA
jgi:hypothetical protein